MRTFHDFAVPVDHGIKLKECEKKDKYLHPARELKKLWKTEVSVVPIVIGVFWHSDWMIIRWLGGFGIWRMCGDYPDDSIIEDDQHTEKSLGDLRRLDVTQTPVKHHQLTLTWKTLKE